MGKKIRSFFCAVLCGLLIGVQVPGKLNTPAAVVSAEEFEEQLYANAAVLMDASSGRVLFGKNEDTLLAMASTTKIMTCILVLEMGNPDDTLEISSYAASMPKVKLNVRCGEVYRVKDLLYSLMLESHNDAAVALAEYVGKKELEEDLQSKPASEYTMEESKRAVAAFAKLMNQKAAELGCEHTCFITPNGLDATETITTATGEVLTREHGTTAAELARIMSYCIMQSPQKDAFLKITQTLSYQFEANGRNYFCNNHNAFLSMMPGAISGKTGFTNKAGYCYVGALERDGKTFVVALLACGWPNNKNYKWSDTRKLMEYGLKEYHYRRFDEEGIRYKEKLPDRLEVEDGQTATFGEKAYTGLEVREMQQPAEGLLLREEEQIVVECEMERLLKAPVSAGTIVGHIDYKVDDVLYKRETIIACQNVLKIDYKWCFLQALKRFLLN